jgi:hypothetical protein
MYIFFFFLILRENQNLKTYENFVVGKTAREIPIEIRPNSELTAHSTVHNSTTLKEHRLAVCSI